MPYVGVVLAKLVAEVEAATKIRATYLRALESDGKGRILSTPRVATQNNVEAEITQGLDRTTDAVDQRIPNPLGGGHDALGIRGGEDVLLSHEVSVRSRTAQRP